MKLSPEDVHLFYKLYPALLQFVNERYNIVDAVSSAQQLISLPPEDRYQLRERLFENDELIDEFVKKNPQKFPAEEIAIVASWKYYLKGTFYLLRQLKKYAIFLSSDKEAKAYGVVSLMDAFDVMLPFMPIVVDTVLLPFKNQIIYDGLISSRNMYFGGNIKRSFNNSYNEAKAKYGIITTLPFEEKKQETSDEDQLKYYLRSEYNREYYWEEIQQLYRKNEANKVIYYANSTRKCKKWIKAPKYLIRGIHVETFPRTVIEPMHDEVHILLS